MESADPETTIPEEKRVIASPRLMNPPYFLLLIKCRGATMIGVGEENTRPSMTRVLDQITEGEGVCYIVQTF